MENPPIPATPQIIAPSPTEVEPEGGAYFPPTTRSATKQRTSVQSYGAKPPFPDDLDSDRRARPRDRSPQPISIRRRGTGTTFIKPKLGSSTTVQRSEPLVPNGLPYGFLSPASAAKTAQYYWRELSRSPSPLGLIPIHQSWRSFIHRHEVPRKVLHISIGFLTLWIYEGRESSDIYPWLIGAAIPITAVDVIRHNFPSFNRLYVQLMGAFMRETEVHDKYNGVIFYLYGTWAVLRFFPKDVGVLSILLLSWCDTAASTVGRLYGKYTPRVRRGKSLAGSAAAALVGFLTCLGFYGFFAPSHGGIEPSFMFKGHLKIPRIHSNAIWDSGVVVDVRGWAAYIILSLMTGLIASLSEAVDLFGIDDNLTIPVLSAIGLWAFLKGFG